MIALLLDWLGISMFILQAGRKRVPLPNIPQAEVSFEAVAALLTRGSELVAGLGIEAEAGKKLRAEAAGERIRTAGRSEETTATQSAERATGMPSGRSRPRRQWRITSVPRQPSIRIWRD
jgi:hypothetical protein